MSLDLTSLKQAVNSLERTIAVSKDVSKLSKDQQEAIKAGVIQNFEFTYELCWKFMKRWLEENLGSTYVDGIVRKELFRIAAENLLIDNTKKWFEYHKARNETVHTYALKTAELVYMVSIDFLDAAKVLLKNLEDRNDY